ncbi:MAG: hypothetical protein RLZ53_49 [Actinomycetota bacterium]|jgi:hypothetical protein
MKSKFAVSTVLVGAVLASQVPMAASAFWAWGPTWTTPSASRYLYVWSSSFTSAQQTAIANANMAYDSSKTNAFDPGDPGSSTLHISGTTFSTNATAYANATFKISRQTSTWTFGSRYVGFTCLGICGTISPGANRSTIYLNDVNFNFGTSFIPSLTSPTVDLQTIVLHELGHSHGLGHPEQIHNPFTPAEAASVMYVNETVKRSLTSDDIKGLEVNY